MDDLLGFPDMEGGAYYTETVRRAVSEGVTGCYDIGDFGANDSITREQLAMMLHRHAQYQGMDVVTSEENLSGYADADSVFSYAVQTMNWAVGQGILNGTSAAALIPQGAAPAPRRQ